MAIVELGWSTAASLDGTQDDQAAFVQQAFEQLAAHQDRIAFLTWFSLHDGFLENCEQSALTFIPHCPDLAADEVFMTDFVDFLCNMGLRENDGTEKLGWHVWVEESNTYLEARGAIE